MKHIKYVEPDHANRRTGGISTRPTPMAPRDDKIDARQHYVKGLVLTLALVVALIAIVTAILIWH